MDTKEKTKRPAAARPGRSGTRTAPPRGRQSGSQRTVQRGPGPKRPAQRKPTPDVVYTQPGPFNSSRFLIRLITVVAVVFALVFGMSIFFKVKTVTVAGVEKYTEWEIMEASGIREGENLLSVSEAKISSNIRSRLPYVNTIRVGIKLPDTVKIEIEELAVVYSVEATDGSHWLMRSDGTIVEKTNAADAAGYTAVKGVTVAEPVAGQMAVAAEPVPEETTEEGQTLPVTVSGEERMDAAVSLLQYLEENGIVGEAASLDVSDMGQIEIWYEDRFQILLGDTTQLSYKVKMVCAAINQYMKSYDSGVLDASMTVQPDPEKEYQVIYTPFE